MLVGGCFAFQTALWTSLHNAFMHSVMSLILKPKTNQTKNPNNNKTHTKTQKVKYVCKLDAGSELLRSASTL